MAFTDGQMADIKDSITQHPEASDLNKMAHFGADVPALIVATLAAQKSADFDVFLEPYANESSEIRGRSKPATTGAEPDPESEVEEFYVRPNGQKYYTRKWGEHHHDVQVLRRARERKHFTYLYGPPGTGKTALCEAAFGEDLLTVVGSGDTEPGDFVGGFVQTPSGAFEWVDGPLIRAMEEGKVLLVDEVGLIDSKSLSVLYGPMDGRDEYTVTANPERGTIKAAPGFFIIGATNPNAPGVRLSEALLSRFTLQAEMTTDWELARKVGVPLNVISIGQNLERKYIAGQVGWGPQFRELLAFRDIKADFGETFALANLLALAPELDRPVVQALVDSVLGKRIEAGRI